MPRGWRVDDDRGQYQLIPVHYQRELVSVNEKVTLQHQRPCSNCKLPISSSQLYRCACGARLHTYCQDIPAEIHHPRHPDHPLVLRRSLLHGSMRSTAKCSCCHETVLTRGMDTYSCKTCRFQIDVLCAFLPGFGIEHGSHPQHPLIPVSEEVLFLCHACGTWHHGRPLICNMCGFWIARGCAQRLPLGLDNFPYHPQHLVKLGYSLPAQYGNQMCQICEKPMNPMYWVYYCVDDDKCSFFAHVTCATNSNEPFMSILNPGGNRWVDEYMDALYKKTFR